MSLKLKNYTTAVLSLCSVYGAPIARTVSLGEWQAEETHCARCRRPWFPADTRIIMPWNGRARAYPVCRGCYEEANEA